MGNSFVNLPGGFYNEWCTITNTGNHHELTKLNQHLPDWNENRTRLINGIWDTPGSPADNMPSLKETERPCWTNPRVVVKPSNAKSPIINSHRNRTTTGIINNTNRTSRHTLRQYPSHFDKRTKGEDGICAVVNITQIRYSSTWNMTMEQLSRKWLSRKASVCLQRCLLTINNNINRN